MSKTTTRIASSVARSAQDMAESPFALALANASRKALMDTRQRKALEANGLKDLARNICAKVRTAAEISKEAQAQRQADQADRAARQAEEERGKLAHERAIRDLVHETRAAWYAQYDNK